MMKRFCSRPNLFIAYWLAKFLLYLAKMSGLTDADDCSDVSGCFDSDCQLIVIMTIVVRQLFKTVSMFLSADSIVGLIRYV